MISSNGTVTPQARNQEGTEDIREAIGAITETLGNLEGSFVEMNGKSTMLAALSPSPQDAVQDLQALRKQLREETEKRDKDIDSFKRVAREDVKVKIAANLQDDILEYIKAEISAQVKQQVDLHIQDHIPISLKEQSQANKAQLREAKTSLINSAARKKNSSLRIQNLDDALEPVLKSDGTRGKLYPADLRSLLSYDTASLGDLIRDYGLVEDAVREVNLNVFLSHIGIPFEIVSLEDVV